MNNARRTALLFLTMWLSSSSFARAAVAIDVTVSTDVSSASASATSPVFSTTTTNELLLAFISTDYLSGTNTTVQSVSGANLSWALVIRANAQSGTSEIWRAFSPTVLNNVSVSASLSQSVVSSITVMSFSGVDTTGTAGSGAIGASSTANGVSGGPTATLVTTRANSLVLGVGNDYDRPIARTVGSGQTMVHYSLASVGDTYWVQRRTTFSSPSGTAVTINDTAPTSDRWNLAICEVLPSTAPSPLVANAGTSKSGYTGQSQTFSGSASGGTGPYTFSWNFGDGGSASTASASHTFSSGGTFTVTLTVTDSTGTSAQASVTATITTPAPLVANAGPSTTGQVGQSLSFSGSASGGVQPYAFSWSFGDGGSASTQMASHTFLLATVYTVTLTVTDSLGKTATSSISATIVPAPLTAAASGPLSGYTGQTLNFNGSASGGTPSYTFGWNFGDGGTASTAMASHVFTTGGPFTVKLTVTDSSLATASSSFVTTISVPSALVANAGAPVSGFTGQSVSFNGSASGGVGPYSYSWDFGDGGSATTATAAHTFTAAGTFTATLTVSDSLGSQAQASVTATITVSTGNVIFFDDFNGTSLSADWKVISRHGEYAQNETECNTPQQVSVANGLLTITTAAQSTVCGDFNVNGSVRHSPSSWPYATGDIQWASRSFTYGTVEVRAKFPDQKTGLWPAIWLLGSNCQNTNPFTADTGYSTCPPIGGPPYVEIDMVECDKDSWCHMALLDKFNTWSMCSFKVDTNFHVFTLNWSAAQLALAVDGKTACSWDSSHQIPSTPMFLIIQTQTGGVGGDPNNALLPATFVVDYVKVKQP